MSRGPPIDGRRRLIVAAAIVALHLALLALLFSARSPVTVVRQETSLTVHAVRAAAPAPPPLAAAVAVDLAVPVIEDAEPGTTVAAPCVIEQAVAAALAADALTVAALTPLAASPTPAIMVWDGRWSTDPVAQSVRRAVVGAVSIALPACRRESLVGPRLIFVPVADKIVSVAIGSGTWSWDALLSDDSTRSQ